MKIYTKGGDAGETGLFGGTRVSKDHTRIQAYGTLDELNAVLGVVLAGDLPLQTRATLTRVQGELFQVGAELATPPGKALTLSALGTEAVTRLEAEIDAMEATLPALKNFILPGGSQSGAALHVARTVSRRGERDVVTLHRAEPVRDVVLTYLNRLSDYLFVAARFVNAAHKAPESPWKP